MYCVQNVSAVDEFVDFIEIREGGVNIEVSKVFLDKLVNPGNFLDVYYAEGLPEEE